MVGTSGKGGGVGGGVAVARGKPGKTNNNNNENGIEHFFLVGGKNVEMKGSARLGSVGNLGFSCQGISRAVINCYACVGLVVI